MVVYLKFQSLALIMLRSVFQIFMNDVFLSYDEVRTRVIELRVHLNRLLGIIMKHKNFNVKSCTTVRMIINTDFRAFISGSIPGKRTYPLS